MRSQKNAIYATLVDHFKLTPWDIGRLTDKQINDIYFHPRTKDGVIEPVQEVKQPKDSLELDLCRLDCLVAQGVIKKENAEEAKERLREKWKTRSSSTLLVKT